MRREEKKSKFSAVAVSLFLSLFLTELAVQSAVTVEVHTNAPSPQPPPPSTHTHTHTQHTLWMKRKTAVLASLAPASKRRCPLVQNRITGPAKHAVQQPSDKMEATGA